MSFGFNFYETEVCQIDKINFLFESHNGTCQLKSLLNIYQMVWTIENFPMETAGMPGSPYSVKFSFTIGIKTGENLDHALNSISGQFIYQVRSGTYPNFSPLGIRYGEYFACGLDNKSGKLVKLIFKINEDADSFIYMFN